MPVPAFRILCCRCGKPVRLSEDVYALDGEWQRRHPGMRGVLACQDCALRGGWGFCEPRGGTLPQGHVQFADWTDGCDSWNHVLMPGTHKAMVRLYPWSGLVQGAEPYLRHVAGRSGPQSVEAAELQALLAEWDATPEGRRADVFGLRRAEAPA
nr:hypothetical protein KitaXyl93_77070 [Kitasatospora sp. Xyl93]